MVIQICRFTHACWIRVVQKHVRHIAILQHMRFAPARSLLTFPGYRISILQSRLGLGRPARAQSPLSAPRHNERTTCMGVVEESEDVDVVSIETEVSRRERERISEWYVARVDCLLGNLVGFVEETKLVVCMCVCFEVKGKYSTQQRSLLIDEDIGQFVSVVYDVEK